jgi:alkanesulfonate monooxygenase SsuD/methylene tetrahydromethanopterin reductase-like flavin-dependent oxidoreductase (luciferase family)
MRLGIMTPTLSYHAGAADWVKHGTIADVSDVVVAAERLGYGFCTCSEHVALPPEEIERRSIAYWDPLASFSYLAATTSAIDLVVWLVVLGYHHPVELAKRYGQLDLMSNGRLVHAPRTEIPMWVGGRTRRSLRRGIELGDGWMPFALGLDDIAATMEWGQQLRAWEGRDGRPFELLVTSPELDPLGDPDTTAARVRKAKDAGVTQWAVEVRSTSKAHYVEQLGALRDLADSLLG